ncbi:MAG: alpha/beta hydrolase family esterase, partial [Myxococcales bacterium]
VPKDYDQTKPTPLRVLLHGYGANGSGQTTYFRLAALADRKTFLLAAPNGTVDRTGRQFWNATDSCCDIYGNGVDDVAYLGALIADVQRRFNVDPKRIWIVGHSNGGFMAHRLACELSDRIAGIVSLAGAAWKDPTRCGDGAGVAVLQVHGDADLVIAYDGGRPSGSPSLPPHPSARDSVAQWATRNGCAAALTPVSDRLDLDTNVAGAETRVDRHLNCARGAAELWTMEKSGHIPGLNATWPEAIYGFLQAHPKP